MGRRERCGLRIMRPGDALIVTVDARITVEQAMQMRESLMHALGTDRVGIVANDCMLVRTKRRHWWQRKAA